MLWNTLLKKTAIFVIIVLFFGTGVIPSLADEGFGEPGESPEVFMVNETTIKLTIPLQSFEFGSVSTENGEFATVTINGKGCSTTVGKPRLPLIKYMLEIPQGADPEIDIASVSWRVTSLENLDLPDRIIPVQPSVLKIPDAEEKFVIDTNYYATNAFTPVSVVTIADHGKIRERRFILVEVAPLLYNPSSGEIKTMTSCEIFINLPGSDLATTYETIKRFRSSSFEYLFETLFANYGFYEQNIYANKNNEYLIIVYDDFTDEIQPLADFKETMGFNTTVTKTSDIPGGTSKENIHDYIEDAYHEWTTPPSYVLLVGDTPQIPTYVGTMGPSAVDLYYVTMNPEDYFPDMFIGRFPAAKASHVTAMVNKTVYYEHGTFNTTEWITQAACMAGIDNYQITEGTHNYVIDTYLEPNNYTCDKLYMVTYGATTQNVTDALNDGRSLAIYSGHGSTTGWSDGPAFSQSNVNALANKDMYPFVCSHACSTNTFNYPECFGETWLREERKAGLAFWGASSSTLWNEDDILEKGMFKAWWDDGLEWIGGMTDRGLYYLYNFYSGGGNTHYYFEAYNVMGDPSVNLWSSDPNPPPEQPEKPQGPTLGVVNKELTYSSVTTDPDGEQVFYKFNWGDETSSEWIGPYDSGNRGEASHIWEKPGDYEVTVKAKDDYGEVSRWSDPLSVTIIQGPLLDIGLISGGLFRITAEIENVGSTNATNVSWNMSVHGGTIFVGRESSGTIPSIVPDKKEKIQSSVIVGFGTIKVSLTATIPEGIDTRTQNGKVVLFLVYITPGG